MTCIAAVTDGATVWMGGDSAGVAGLDLTIRADDKVFRIGEMVIGFTSSFRMGQILRFGLTLPEHPRDLDDYQYMATRFIDAVRECLKAGGYVKVDNSRETGGTFLVGYRGRIYEVGGDFQVGMAHDDYMAVGCGGQIAHGALYAGLAEGTDCMTDYAEIVLTALKAAEHHSAGVRGPFLLLEHTDAALLASDEAA